MGTRINLYIRDGAEREFIRVALGLYRAKINGLSGEQARVALESVYGQETVAEPFGAKVCISSEPLVIPARYEHWVTEGDVPRVVLEETWAEYKQQLENGGLKTMDDMLLEKGYHRTKPEQKNTDPNKVMMGGMTMAEYLGRK